MKSNQRNSPEPVEMCGRCLRDNREVGQLIDADVDGEFGLCEGCVESLGAYVRGLRDGRTDGRAHRQKEFEKLAAEVKALHCDVAKHRITAVDLFTQLYAGQEPGEISSIEGAALDAAAKDFIENSCRTTGWSHRKTAQAVRNLQRKMRAALQRTRRKRPTETK